MYYTSVISKLAGVGALVVVDHWGYVGWCRRKGRAHDNKRPAALVGCYALCAELGQNIKWWMRTKVRRYAMFSECSKGWPLEFFLGVIWGALWSAL